ncbi:hypothetical protein DFP72DRAFT_1151860 [Ephemerocybe angulata]|uniref:F-box domain-containing protein n=1 Tax=Ephemerocybe angulata TaxID=980116 RepID=A0A8H6ICP6_9AGAR|nr:hypothetical protein DFP72DRAFT_1151860 [Tulosesus angulatus]
MPQKEDENISRLLQSNDVPTPVEAGRVYDDIDDLETEANALRLQLDALEGRLQQRRSIVSSVRRMPAEVLGEIFQLALSSNAFGWRKRCLENFMLVCKAWRNVALITHALWNNISIGGPGNSYRKILAWLSRSGSLSKRLEVAEGLGYGGFCGCEDSEPCRYTDPIIIRLLKEARSLQDLRLHVGRHICLTKFFESLQSTPENPGLQPWKHIKSIGIDFDPSSYNTWPTPLDSFQSFFTQLAFVTSFRLYLPPGGNTSFDNSDPRNATIGIPPRFLSQLLELTIQCDWSWVTYSWNAGTLYQP